MQTDRHENQPTTGFVAKTIHGNVYMTYYFSFSVPQISFQFLSA